MFQKVIDGNFDEVEMLFCKSNQLVNTLSN